MDEKVETALNRGMAESNHSSDNLSDKLDLTVSNAQMLNGCEVSVSDIVEESSWNKTPHYITQGVANPPQWFSLLAEGIITDEQRGLLELQVERLVHASNTSDALPFHSNGYLGAVRGPELRKLSSMVHQLLHHLSIIEMDNLSAILERPRSPKTMRAATNALIPMCQRIDRSHALQAPQFDPESLDAKNRAELYAILIDYITNSVARIATRYTTGSTWSKVNLAVLGQISVKLKFLTRDPSRQIGASLHRAKAARMRASTSYGEDLPNGPSSNEESEMERYDETFEDDYIRSSQGRHKFVMSALQRALRSLLLAPQDVFQTNIQIYTVGPDQTVCAMMEDGTSLVSVTSMPRHVDFCRTGLSLVRENFDCLAKPHSPPPPAPSDAEPVIVSLAYRTSGVPVRTSKLKVYTMDALLSLMVPLSLCTPQLGQLAAQMATCLSLGAEADVPPPRLAMPADRNSSLVGCKLQSKGYLDRARMMSAIHPDTLAISQDSLNPARLGPNTDYEKHRKKIEAWQISDSSVTVRRPWYVAGILILCAGVALAFSVPMGLLAGDPLQNFYCTTAVIGMILFVAKSAWMSDWRWHDFLRGRVVCRSVSEVAAVARVDAQVVLLRLLDHARVSRFDTQGPFNVVFRSLERQRAARDGGYGTDRREKHDMTQILLAGAARAVPRSQMLTSLSRSADIVSGGFSIDRPLGLRTLEACGFLVLTVAGYDGKHLVCLDARKGETIDFVEGSGKSAVLSCLRPPVPKKGEAPTAFLSENRVEWTRLLGVCTGDVVFG